MRVSQPTTFLRRLALGRLLLLGIKPAYSASYYPYERSRRLPRCSSLKPNMNLTTPEAIDCGHKGSIRRVSCKKSTPMARRFCHVHGSDCMTKDERNAIPVNMDEASQLLPAPKGISVTPLLSILRSSRKTNLYASGDIEGGP